MYRALFHNFSSAKKTNCV